MRKLIMFAIATGLLLCAVGCSDKSKKNTENDDTNKNVCDIDCDNADMSEYETMKEDDHVFKEITLAQANDLLSDKSFTGIIYYGYPACPWCEEAVPIMNSVAKENQQTIYYVNKKSQDSLDHPEEEAKAITILDAAYGLDKDENDEPHLYVPEVVVLKQGNITSHHMGTVKNHNAHERKMNEDEARVLKTIYENMFIELNE